MMGSAGSPLSWPLSSTATKSPSATTSLPSPAPSLTSPPANNYNYNMRDCSQGICTIYCQQWCNSPPYLDPAIGNNDDDGSSSRVSPLMVALISVLASAFLLLSYYTIVSKYCKRRRQNRRNHQDSDEELRLDQLISDSAAGSASGVTTANGGLDESFIRRITVFKYNKEDGLIDGSDCAVCLSEFKEEENLRLMPNCQHAFHIPCIDTWLKTNSNCPLCRSGMIEDRNDTNSAATVVVAPSGNGIVNGTTRQEGNTGGNSGGSTATRRSNSSTNNNSSINQNLSSALFREVMVVLVGDDENRGREVTAQLELPVVTRGNVHEPEESSRELGSQQQQQQQSQQQPHQQSQQQPQQQTRIMNQARKEEIQR